MALDVVGAGSGSGVAGRGGWTPEPGEFGDAGAGASEGRPGEGERRMSRAPGRARRRLAPARLFFPLAAVLIVVIAFVGFSRFYMHGKAYPDREIAPPIKGLVIAHAVSMSAWLGLLVVQPTLILARRHKLHMKLGRVAAVFAALVFVIGLLTAVRSAQVTPPDVRLWDLAPKQFFAIPSTTIFVFAAFVALGVVYRRKPHIHRAMMVLGTIYALTAAFDRIDPLKALYMDTVWGDVFGPYFPSVVLGVALVALRSVLARRFDAVFAGGVVVLGVLGAVTMWIAPTSAWAAFASIFVG